jgi:hypothetical protein
VPVLTAAWCAQAGARPLDYKLADALHPAPLPMLGGRHEQLLLTMEGNQAGCGVGRGQMSLRTTFDTLTLNFFVCQSISMC